MKLLLALATAALASCALVHPASRSSAGAGKDGPLSPDDPGYVDPGPFDGPLGQKYQGKVVFSSRPIAMRDTDDSSAFTSYTLGAGPLFVRYFGQDSPQNLLHCDNRPTIGNMSPNTRLMITVAVNGARPIYIGSYNVSDVKVRGAASLTNEIKVPMTTPTTWTAERETAANAIIRQFNSGVMTMLEDGDNTLDVALTVQCPDPRRAAQQVAAGTLHVTVPPGAKATYLATYGTQLGASPFADNARLVPQLLKALRREPGWDRRDLLGAEVTSPDWETLRNQLTGVATGKEVSAAVIAHAKDESHADACRLFVVGFARDADGGEVRFAGADDGTPIPCRSAPR